MKWDDIKPVQPAQKGGVMKWDDIQPVAQKRTPLQNVGRQAGLLARSLIKGPLDVADFVTTPVRESLNLIPGVNIQAGALQESIPEALGLPTPEGMAENVLTKGAEMAGGAGAFMKGAQVIGKALPATAVKAKDVLSMMSANPFLQMTSAAAGGGAGEYVKQEGGGPTEQLLASLGAGLGTGLAVGAVQKVATAGKSLLDSFNGSPKLNAQIDITIQNALKQSGINAADVPASVMGQLRADVQKSIKSGTVSPDAARRLADYRLVGATPTAANLTLDPAAVSQQRNLAKIGINSQDPALQKLGQVQNVNNRVLIENLNRMGADTTDDNIAAAQKIITAIEGKNTTAKSAIDDLYKLARTSEGRSVEMDAHYFTTTADDMLTNANRNRFLPTTIREMVNDFASGKTPFNVNTADQFKTILGNAQRTEMDGNVKYALGLVRDALEKTPALEGQGQKAMAAFDAGRKAHSNWMSVVDKTPALQAVRDGVQPDKFVQTYIVGTGKDANIDAVTRLGELVKGNPDASIAIRDNLAQYLKSKAISGAADEVGNFSQSAYNKALQSIGDRKLSLFFKPEEINQLKAIGRVASYEQFQPKGSAVNNSNTAGAAIATILDKLGSSPILRKIPLFSEIVGNPVKNVTANIQAGKAMDVKNALALPRIPERQAPAWMIPIAASSGE